MERFAGAYAWFVEHRVKLKQGIRYATFTVFTDFEKTWSLLQQTGFSRFLFHDWQTGDHTPNFACWGITDYRIYQTNYSRLNTLNSARNSWEGNGLEEQTYQQGGDEIEDFLLWSYGMEL